jgi:hypothetical protein
VGGHLIFAIGGVDSCFADTDLIEVYDTNNPQLGWQDTSTQGSSTYVPELPVLGGAALLSAVGMEPGTPGNDLGAADWAIVVIGGKNSSGFSSVTEAFLQGGSHWLGEDSLPLPVDQGAAVVDQAGCVDLIGGSVLEGGGLTGTPTGSIETLCQPFSSTGASATWKTNALTLDAGIDGEAAVQDSAGNSYVLGGSTSASETFTGVFKIGPKFAAISGLSETSVGHFGGGAAVSGSNLYAIGGQNFMASNFQNTVEVLDLTDTAAGWSMASALIVPRFSFATVTDGAGDIYVIGGLGGTGTTTTTLGSVEVLNAGATNWTLLP